MKLSERSLRNLEGIHPKLREVVKRAIEITPIDFGITEGLRSIEKQKQLVKEGKSRTLRSYHLTGKAVDVVAYVDGKVTWDWQPYVLIAEAFKQAADEVGVRITWGGIWEDFRDGPHFQIEDV